MFKVFGASALVVICPVFSMFLVHASTGGGDVSDLIEASMPTSMAVKTLISFWALILALYFVPGPTKCGPVTPTGHVPTYTDNGIVHMVVFVAAFVGGSALGLYPLSVLFVNLMSIVGTLNVCAFLFCIYLYVKGCTHPSTSDVTFSGRGFTYDFFSGIELYPRVLGVDVKKAVNCRFSMTFWMVFGLSCVAASRQIHGEYDWGLCWCAALTFCYLVTFFLWEIGYMRSIDIIEDNAGFMETWGCLVFVPVLYTNHMHCAVHTPSEMHPIVATAIGLFGMACIVLTYWINRQRQVFRETDGVSMLWWPVRPEKIIVYYSVQLPGGQLVQKTSILLVNGFWGLVRHPQYIPELGIALSWGLLTNPTLRYGQSMIYFVFLCILLFHRALRDASKCKRKYGNGYEKYVERVKYMIIPGLF